MKCLLIDSHWQRAVIGPRLSLGCLASAVCDLMEVEGLEFLFDETELVEVKRRPGKFWVFEQQFLHAIENKVRADPEIRLVGVTGWSGSFPRMLRIAHCCKMANPQVAVVFGGPHVTLHETWCPPEKSILRLHPEVDFLVLGEGEEPFRRLVRGLLTGPSRIFEKRAVIAAEDPGTPGKHYLRQTCTSYAGSEVHWQPFLRNRYARYRNVFFVESARGCPHRCKFCDERDLWTCYRRLNVSETVNQIEWGIEILGSRSFRFADSTLTANPSMKSICEEIVRRDLGVSWSAFAHCSEITEEKAALMAYAGCKCVLVGIESGDQSVLDAMNKGTTIERLRMAIDALYAHGIRVRGSFIIGYAGETLAQARKTIGFARALGLDAYAWHLYQPPFRSLWTQSDGNHLDFAHYELDCPPEVVMHVLMRDPALLRDMHALPRLASLTPSLKSDPARWPKRSVELLCALQEALAVTGETGGYDLDVLVAEEQARRDLPDTKATIVREPDDVPEDYDNELSKARPMRIPVSITHE